MSDAVKESPCCWSTASAATGVRGRPVMGPLAARRSVVAIDLPGFGKSPPLAGRRQPADAGRCNQRNFCCEHDLIGTDAVGSSMGARLVLELARRGDVLGVVVTLGPAGFWAGWERYAFQSVDVAVGSAGARAAVRDAGHRRSFGSAHAVAGAVLGQAGRACALAGAGGTAWLCDSALPRHGAERPGARRAAGSALPPAAWRSRW